MSKTLLNAVNDVLRKVGEIRGENRALTSLNSNAKQHLVDLVVDSWNEEIEGLFSILKKSVPNETQVSNITLVSGHREYDLPSGIVKIKWPLMDIVNGNSILEFKGGYEALRRSQPVPGNHQGTPFYACVNPSNGKLYFDTVATDQVSGTVYELFYEKDVSFVVAEDLLPISGPTYRQMVVVVAERIKYDRNKKEFNSKIYRRARANAARLISL